MKSLLKKVILAVVVTFLSLSSYADTNVTPKDIKSTQKAMSSRLKQLVEYKKAGKIGENYLGYLVVKTKGDKTLEALVKAENSDRKFIYEQIAKKVKSSSEQVGKQRAKQIAEKAKKGEWLVDEKGKWTQKVADDTKH